MSKTTDAPAPYNHAGIPIHFDQKFAEFKAVVNGKVIESPSLVAIKKRIDAARKNVFVSFTALDFEKIAQAHCKDGDYYDRKDRRPTIDVLRVKEIKPEKRRYGGSDHRFVSDFVSGKEDRYQKTDILDYVLVPDTAEARAAIESYFKLAQANYAEVNRLEKEIDAAFTAVPRIKAGDLIKAKVKS